MEIGAQYGFIGDIVKFTLLTWIAFWILAIVYFAATANAAMLVLFLVGFLVPLSMIAHEYMQSRKSKHSRIRQHA